MSSTGTPHVFVATPCYGGMVTQAYTESVLALVIAAAGRGLRLSLGLLGQDALITRSRNTLVARFLATDATHLLFVDADIGFAPDHVFGLLAREVMVVGGLYPIRATFWDEAAARRLAAGETAGTAALRYVGEPSGPAREDGLIPARFAGTGFLLIAREVFARMIACYPETRCRAGHVAGETAVTELHALFDCGIDRDGTYLSEDYLFCARWRATGGELWLDPVPRLSHNGMGEFVGDPAGRLISA